MGFRPLTGNHLVNFFWLRSVTACHRYTGFRPLTGNHLVNRDFLTHCFPLVSSRFPSPYGESFIVKSNVRNLKYVDAMFPSPYGESFSKWLEACAMVDKAKKSFRPLTGNHLVNLTRKDVKENSGIILFPSPYGESFSKCAQNAILIL